MGILRVLDSKIVLVNEAMLEFHLLSLEGLNQRRAAETYQDIEDRERSSSLLRSAASASSLSRPARYTDLTGYTADEAIGRNPRMLKSGTQPPEFCQELWETILSGQEWRGEFCNRKKNGDVYWEQSFVSPIRGEGGEVTHFVAVKEDITERKQAT